MDDSLLTKCPHCKTLFRIQHEHLAIANGEVRCGVCYRVFNAREEGIAYSEEERVTPAPKTSRAEAAQITANLEVETETAAEQKADFAPSELDIDQLVINEEAIEDYLAEGAPRRFQRPWLWGSLSLAAALVLALQWLWFEKDYLAAEPKWRLWLESPCQILGCQLPPFVAVNQIATERLTIRAHDHYENVLRVELIINNQAVFDQPLPALSLAFFDLNSNPVAKRLLQPKEYLNPKLQLTGLPRSTPVHLSFAILDPGAEAVNYMVALEASR